MSATRPASRRTASRRGVRAAIVLGALALAASACGGNGLDRPRVDASARNGESPADPTTTTEVVPLTPPDPASGFPSDWAPEPLRWEPCDGVDAECARLTVPLDWSQPDGTQIDLVLARQRARGDRLGALVTNPGGPGASGVTFLADQPFGDELTERFDVVSWDPRGVGGSSPLRCGSTVDDFLGLDSDPDDPAEQAAIETAAAAVAAECARLDAEVLPFVGTDDTARDLEAIRLALGEPGLTFMGFSYGTFIGERYLALFADRVRAMVLDGVVDPTEGLTGLLEGQVVAISAAFERALDACGRRNRCPVADPADVYDDLRREVETRVLPASTDVGPAELATAAIFATYDPRLWEPLHRALASGATGDGRELWSLASGYYDLGDWTAYAAITCLDSPRPQGPDAYRTFVEALRSASSRFGGPIGNEMLPCAYWPVPTKDVTGAVAAPASPPILVVGNTGDAATPYDDAVDVAEQLANGALLTYEGEGHTSYGRDTCVDEAIHAYLIELVVPDGRRCGAGSSRA